ncbi:MAG TPA: SusE domain-containing protein [Prolixibacteraceae bacterium]|nr:SusE domain-containing protein [Prolixibacteraceae bacterium]
MKNIVKTIIVTLAVALIFSACNKEGDLPFYKEGAGSVTLSSSVTSVTAAMSDSDKTVLPLSWTWPNYATDSVNQKFIVQIAPAGSNFEKPYTKVVKGKKGTALTAKELNSIVFGFGNISGSVPLDVRVISSYANNNEQYKSNTVNVAVTPYVIPVNLTLEPAGPLTLTVENAASSAVKFNWNATRFGNLPLNYAVQIDKAGGDFKTPLVLPFGAKATGDITVNDLNSAAINAGIAPNTSGDLAIRVIAGQGANYENPVYSNVATLSLTPYIAKMTWYVPGDYVAASYPGTTLADWTPDKSPTVESAPTSPTKLEGYVYMKNASNQWKFASKPNWDGPNYGDGGAGKLSASGGNITLPAGYYKLNADATALTYTAVATVWSVIGSAPPGEAWTDDTPLTYDPALRTWTGGLHMKAGEFKFRANGGWDINYGTFTKGATDGKLNAGGENIAVADEADYAITLDLSHPNAYTYTANRWGLIGDATPGGWDSDQNMTWDATNQVFTITLDLTAAKIKFRANDAWDINLGGDINALTQNGADIAVAAAGNYTITLNPWTLKATVTKN